MLESSIGTSPDRVEISRSGEGTGVRPDESKRHAVRACVPDLAPVAFGVLLVLRKARRSAER
jgi:hypothetical protein